MTIETFKYVGSVHLLPHISIVYDSSVCNSCISIGWLWWGISIVDKHDMHI